MRIPRHLVLGRSGEYRRLLSGHRRLSDGLGGHEVLMLEQYEPGHVLGASYGETRNFNPVFVVMPRLRLLQHANILWDEITEAGESLRCCYQHIPFLRCAPERAVGSVRELLAFGSPQDI